MTEPGLIVSDASQAPPPGRSIRPASAKYRAAGVSRWRFVRAYTTTFAVIFTYLGLSFKTRLFGRAYRDARIEAVHRRSSRRVYETILALQGLFIKVGQLLSIMASFLPDAFRSQLEEIGRAHV